MEDSENNILTETRKFLVNRANFTEKQLKQTKILFVCVTGSQAYNLNFDSSDIKNKIVQLNSNILTPDLLFSFEPGEQFQTISTLPNQPKPDFTLHEGKKFGQLLLKGNPFVFETLFIDKTPRYESPEWLALKENRTAFITQPAVEQLLNYVKDQIRRHKTKPLVGKRYYHIIRLLQQVENMIDKKNFQMFLEDSPERDILLKIKQDKCTEIELESLSNELIQKIEEKRPWNSLPKDMPNELLLNWLIEARRSHFVDMGWLEKK